jgi:branched-chain amino acid transport system permease protein
MGYLTLRLKGIYFAIATLALAVVAETFITNWDYVGGSAGAYVLHPRRGPWFGSYVEYLFMLMLALATLAVAVARAVERSWLGLGLRAIRDDEDAAETSGVPTLRLKLFATGLSGALMGMAGAPLPYYVTFLEPASAFNLGYAVTTIAMPMIGGTKTWLGPLLGGLLLATAQQVATVTISSEINLLVVGVLLVGFVMLAPNGIVGWFRRR